MVVSAHVVPDSFIGSLIFSRLWQPLARLYLKYVYNRSKEVIAVSPQVKIELERLACVQKYTFYVIVLIVKNLKKMMS